MNKLAVLKMYLDVIEERNSLQKQVNELKETIWLDSPDNPGWWAFEGSEWDQQAFYEYKGKEYDEWQEEWTEEAEEYWHRYELELIPVSRYETVPGESFQTIVEIKWIQKGESINSRKHSGPHNGEPVLGFVSPKYTWSAGFYGIDTWTGKWQKLNISWSNK